MACKNVKETFPAGCCVIDCTYATTGVLKNDDLNENAVMELYENYLRKHGGGKFDKWMEIIEKSIQKCSKAGELHKCNFF